MRILLYVVLLALAGCSADKKLETICTDIVKLVVTDPSSFKINSLQSKDYPLEEKELDTLLKAKYKDWLDTEGGKRMIGYRKEELGKILVRYVTIDYTANERGGPIRDRAMCQYTEWADGKRELVNVSMARSSLSMNDLKDFFLLKVRPKHLSYTGEVE